MKLRAPDGVSSPFSHRGRIVYLTDDRCVDVPDDEAEALLAHGFWPHGAAMASTSADETCGEGAAGDVAADAIDVERMSRIELFAFLRARRIGVALPIRNDDLRSRARAALADAREAG